MRDYPLTVTYLGSKGATVKEYIRCRKFSLKESWNFKLRCRLRSGWEPRETRSHELPTPYITKGQNLVGR